MRHQKHIAIPTRRVTRAQRISVVPLENHVDTNTSDAHLKKSHSMPSFAAAASTSSSAPPSVSVTTTTTTNNNNGQNIDWGVSARRTREEIYHASEMLKGALLEKKRGGHSSRYQSIVQRLPLVDQRGLLIIYTSITSIDEINEVLSPHHHRDLLAALFQPQLDKVWSEKWIAPRATSPNTANGTRRQLWFGSNVSTPNNPAAIDPIARIALPESTSNAYNNMLLHLLHCNLNTYLDPIISLCVAHFQPVITDVTLATNHEKMEEEWHRQAVKYEHVHEILRAVVRLVPMYREILLEKLHFKNPSAQQPKLLHQHYLENLLVLSKYAVDLRKDITTMVVDKIMELDAQVKIEGDDDDDDDDDDQLNMMFSSLQPADISSRYYNRIMADKLDSVMLLFFRHIESINKDSLDGNGMVNNASPSSTGHLESIFRSILSTFEEKVIRSSKLHSTQFLIFFICSMSSSFSKAFIEYLMTIIMDTHRHTITRVMGIMYIASFLSRANYLTEDMVVLTLGHLTQYIRHYIKTFESTVTTIDVKSHQIFYSMSQCVFYVLCYKIDQVMNAGSQSKGGGGGGKEYLTRLLLPDLVALVNSRFNPFKVLPTDVVEEVTRTFKKYELHDFTETVDRNREIVISEGQILFAQENHIGASQTGLSTEDIFPFDPFLLAQSKDYIEPIYQHWHYGRTDGSSIDHYGSGSFSSSAGTSSAGGINIYARRHHMDDMDESSFSMGSTPGSYLGTGSLSIHSNSNRRQIGSLLSADMAMGTPSLSDDDNGQHRRQRRTGKASVRYLSVSDLSKNHGRRWGDMDEDMDSADDDDDSDNSDIAADDSSEEYGEEDEDENSLHMHNVRRERRHSDARSGFISILDQRSFARKQGFSQSLANGWAEYLESDDDNEEM